MTWKKILLKLDKENFIQDSNLLLLKKEIENADILLLGPQVRYALEDLKPLCEQNNIPLEVINMIDYGMMNGAKILDQALDLI